jgi:hypothetical protein
VFQINSDRNRPEGPIGNVEVDEEDEEEKQDGLVWIRFICLRQGPVASSFERGNELSISIKKLRGLVRQRTIPTERPPLVCEVSTNFSG